MGYQIELDYFPKVKRRLDPISKKIKIGGETGSLYARNPKGFYDWYVGFAPANKPEVALSALIINGYKWRIKGTYLAQEAFKTYFKNKETAL